MRKLTTDEFLKKFKNKFNDLLGLDFKDFEYTTAHEKSQVRCIEHNNVMFITPSNLMKGSKGCPQCKALSISKKNGYSKDDFVKMAKEVHGDMYDYSDVVWKGVKIPVEIICSKHGKFTQIPQNHYNGYGCSLCGYKTLRNNNFVDQATEVHNVKYDYSKVDYINNYTPVIIGCNKHGDFSMAPRDHVIYQRGCPECYPGNVSWLESQWLDTLNIPVDCRQQRITVNNRTFTVDAKVGNTVYEFWGDYWHGNPDVFSMDDKNSHNGKTFGDLYESTLVKRATLVEAGYTLVEMWESKFKVERVQIE